MSPMRKTCKDAAEVAAALKPFIKAADSVTYSSAGISRQGVADHARLIRSLHAAVPNLSVSKVTLHAALQQVYKDNRLKMNPAAVTEWVDENSTKLKNLMRHVQQMRISPRPAEWFSQLRLFEAGDHCDEEDGGDECGESESRVDESPPPAAVEPGEQATYFVGYDAAAKKAFRRLWSQDVANPPEYALDTYVHDEAKDTDPITARWSDGMCRSIPQCTVKRFRAQDKAKADRLEQPVITDARGTPIVLHWRWDAPKGKKKRRLCVVYHGSSALLTMDTVHFVEDEAATGKWCQEVAQRFAKGEIDKSDCQRLKNELIAVKKKPAAAEKLKDSNILKKPAAVTGTASAATAAAPAAATASTAEASSGELPASVAATAATAASVAATAATSAPMAARGSVKRKWDAISLPGPSFLRGGTYMP